jgi:hypothetical protein
MPCLEICVVSVVGGCYDLVLKGNVSVSVELFEGSIG